MRFRAAIDGATGEMYLPVEERGRQLLEEPLLNKGTAFTPRERDVLQLRGLLPPHTSTMEEQLQRVEEAFHAKDTDLERAIYMAALHDRNETLFFRFILENLEETVPIIYTPVVAEACRHWSRIHREPRGIYLTPDDRGSIARVLRTAGNLAARVIVVTDNERILGIGDQGVGGMGIPIGKLALYTAAAGIHPSLTVPISLDVGTTNQELLDDPLYLGWRGKRLRGEAYDTLIEEFVLAVKEVFPNALLQWEDFANVTSFHNLETYRDVVPSFNDDIEGTAATVVGGLLAGMRITGGTLSEQTYVIVGAGSAGTGIYDRLVATMVDEGLTEEAARARVMVTDSHGLLFEGRSAPMDARKKRMAAAKDTVRAHGFKGKEVAHDALVEQVKPSVLIGVCGKASTFTEPMIRAMTEAHAKPFVLPLSNPTSKAEAVPADILSWSGGRAIIATGSPFPDVTYEGAVHRIGQANNVFVFPGIGLGCVVSNARKVTPGMFNAATRALAAAVEDETLKTGSLYPPISRVREISHLVARAVANQAIAEGVAREIVDVENDIGQMMWRPVYLPYRPA
ncbi:MAG: NAD-dependent malic enzyme [Actinobacteria bacterium]|nr:NAD-dependent malic enzyme [Actinomycetota bacterium]MBU1493220.1 NAD-dependent malic enzyme [Actinomycetota bacterium]MBU1865492.1 NAD-dependent malic enzyme [Actinomycetota bacterium]